MKKELKMPKTKFEAIVFTAITAWMGTGLWLSLR